MEKMIRHKHFFPHSAEVVWKYLTEPALMAQWLMPNNFQPIIGHDFQFRIGPIPSLDFDGIFYCKVLEIVPLQRLSYSWRSGPGDGSITLDSKVTWNLHRRDNGTELLLEHIGFAKEENLAFYKGLSDGWVEKLQNIANLLTVAQHVPANT